MARLRQSKIILHVTMSKTEIKNILAAKNFERKRKWQGKYSRPKLLQPITATKVIKDFYVLFHA